MVLKFYAETIIGLDQYAEVNTSGADVTYDGQIDCKDAIEILKSYVQNEILSSEKTYFMPVEIPIPLGTKLKYIGTDGWSKFLEPKASNSMGIVNFGTEVNLIDFLGNDWYQVEIDNFLGYMNIPENEIGRTFEVF